MRSVMRTGSRTAWWLSVLTVAVFAIVAVLLSVTTPLPQTASADPVSPHITSGAVADGCAACHRLHTGKNDVILQSEPPESALCLNCHNGTGANTDIAAEYDDRNVPADDPNTFAYYAHRLDPGGLHTSAQTQEFAGVLNGHSTCCDCHNPHVANGALAFQTANGWAVSGATAGVSGASALASWQNPINYEYQLCLKCHSRYTVLPSSSKPSYNYTDRALEFDPGNASYHPVEVPGKNTRSQMQNSLNGGKLWRLSTGSTIRCTQCHGNYRLVGDPPVPDTPSAGARLAPHSSRYRGILIANYRNRELKPRAEPYNAADFALCYLCHIAAPFTDRSGNARSDTNFRFHGYHMVDIGGEGSGGLDIDVAGAGQGNAICSECHFETHSTRLAPWAQNENYPRGVGFAPNVQPRSGATAPVWNPTNRTCSLICHGKDHQRQRAIDAGMDSRAKREIIVLSNKRATLALRECLSFPCCDLPEALESLKQYVSEGAILSTCHRVELYAAAEGLKKAEAELKRFWSSRRGVRASEFEPHVYVLS